MRPRRHPIETPPADWVGDRLMEPGVEIEVRPQGDKWHWEAWYTFGGRQSPGAYSELVSRRHPRPYCVAGVHRDQDEAWRRARESADNMRAVIARLHDEQAQTFTERAA